MASKTTARQVKSVLKNADDIINIFTGKRLRNIVGVGINLFGDELARKAASMFTGVDEPELPLDNPYAILGLHPEAMTIVVKGAFRSLAREYHPDTGTKPNPERFQAALEAYNTIMKERKSSE